MSEAGANSGSDARSGTSTSRSLLQRARDHEAAAWERLVELYSPLVSHWCRACGLESNDAADVFQDVFQAVARHLEDFRRDRAGDTFRGWLRAIALNKVRDHFRRRQREPGGVGGSEALRRMDQVPDTALLEEEGAEHDLLHRALNRVRDEFEPRSWQAFWRTAVDGRSAPDVASELAMSAGAVRVAKSRILHRIRTELGDQPGPDDSKTRRPTSES